MFTGILALRCPTQNDSTRQLRENFLVEFHFKLFHQLGTDIVKVVFYVGHGTMSIEKGAVFPLLDKCDPACVVRSLVKLIPQTAWFFMGWRH